MTNGYRRSPPFGRLPGVRSPLTHLRHTRTTWLPVGLAVLLVGALVPAVWLLAHAPRTAWRANSFAHGPSGDVGPSPRGSASPGPSPSPSPSPSVSPQPKAIADMIARIPKFGPAPTPEPMTVSAGPLATWVSRVPTTQKVAFITIDDGTLKVAEAIPLLQAAHVPVTLFLTVNFIRDNPAYFRQLQAAGAVIEAHTLTHTELKGTSYGFQKNEICGSADQLGGIFGRRPVLFRPPFGDEDLTTLRAAHDCGMKAAFFWKETVNEGIVRYQEGHLQAGDIILMHFRPAFVEDFLAALRVIYEAGLTPALLEDYISLPGTVPDPAATPSTTKSA